jgi:hypothetical protein
MAIHWRYGRLSPVVDRNLDIEGKGGSGSDFEIKREFGLSHRDFYRIFPRVEPTARKISDLIFELVREDGSQLRIELSAEQIRRLATLRIPYIDITFRFTGWSETQRAEFFEKFDRSFQKGGG